MGKTLSYRHRVITDDDDVCTRRLIALHFASGFEPLGPVQEALRGMELGAGQRRVARYGVPRADVAVAPRGPDRVVRRCAGCRAIRCTSAASLSG